MNQPIIVKAAFEQIKLAREEGKLLFYVNDELVISEFEKDDDGFHKWVVENMTAVGVDQINLDREGKVTGINLIAFCDDYEDNKMDLEGVDSNLVPVNISATYLNPLTEEEKEVISEHFKEEVMDHLTPGWSKWEAFPVFSSDTEEADGEGEETSWLPDDDEEE